MARKTLLEIDGPGRRPRWKKLAGGLCGGLSGIVALPITAWAQERPWGWHPMWGMWGAWGFGMMLFMPLVLGAGDRGRRAGDPLAGDPGA